MSRSLRTLRGHLDEALRQQSSSGQPVAITLIVYDLPNRDCAALASNGELLIAQDGLNRYKTEYIDPIASILADPAYRSLRIVTVIEPDSLPNLVTNLGIAPCAEANSTGAYVQGIRYAITKLHPMSNVYMYLDIAHSGWLGWDTNFNPAVTLFTNTLDAGQGGPGLTSIDGFITDTANYTPTEEPFLPTTSTPTSTSRASTGGHTVAAGATRAAPASAPGRRRPRPLGSTPTSGSSLLASRTASAPTSRTRPTPTRSSTRCATPTPAAATTTPSRPTHCPTRRMPGNGSQWSSRC